MGNIFNIIGAARKGGLRGLGGLGELAVYPAVARLQRQLNGVKAFYPDWTPGADIGDDGKYGRTTHGRLKSFIRWATRRVPVISSCAGIGTDELDRSGPASVATCMNRTLFGEGGLSADELNQIQQAFREWKDNGAVQENNTPVPTAPAGSDGSPADSDLPVKDEGWSTGTKVLVGVGIAGGLGLIVWLLFGDKKRR